MSVKSKNKNDFLKINEYNGNYKKIAKRLSRDKKKSYEKQFIELGVDKLKSKTRRFSKIIWKYKQKNIHDKSYFGSLGSICLIGPILFSYLIFKNQHKRKYV